MIAQVGIATLGVAAIYLVNHSEPRAQRWGPICGLAAQPFWLYETITEGQYGIALMCGVYTYAWYKGLKNRWGFSWLSVLRRLSPHG